MKKKSIIKICCMFFVLLLLLPVLAGCQNNPEADGVSENTEEPFSSESTDQKSTGAVSSSDSVSQNSADPVQASQTKEGSGIVETAETESGGEEHAFEIYSKDGIQVWFIRALDYETNTVLHWIKEENAGKKNVSFTLEDIVWNSVFTLDDQNLLGLEPGEWKYYDLTDLDEAVYASGENLLTDLSFRLVIMDRETYEPCGEQEVRIELPDKTPAGLYFESYLDAQAEEQVLLDNEDVKISLLHLGRLLTSDYSSKYFRGFVRFENKSGYDRPVGVESIRINGLSIDVLADQKETLEKWHSCIHSFRVSEDDLAKNGITSISSVSLMLLSDNSEITGTVALSGGSWYDIELSEAGIAEDESEPEGELIFDEADVQIYLNGGERTEWSFADSEDEHNFVWYLTVYNNSDADVELNLIDEQLDGADLPEDKHLFIDSDEEVGYHSRRNMPLRMYDWPSEKSPEVRFRVQLRTVGGGAIVYTSEEPVVIPAGLY